MNCHRILVGFIAFFAVVPSVSAVTFETVPIGNAGNGPDNNQFGYGSIEYDYRVGKYEVTNAEYVEFLNGVDPAGANTLSLYNTLMSTDALGGIVRNSAAPNGLKYDVKAGREANPVDFVSWYDALRYTNWLHNGQGNGDTESGAYSLLGHRPIPSNASSIRRNPGAKWWLPSITELYKAAYHKNDGVTSNYWDYPFASNSVPASDQPPGNDAPLPSNTANFYRDDGLANGFNDGYAVTGSTMPVTTQNYLTNVGAYPLSKSPYGTFDQGGNVAEWYDSRNGITPGVQIIAGLHGGSWSPTSPFLGADSGGAFQTATSETSQTGFRVAAIPEPSHGPINISVDFDSSVDVSDVIYKGTPQTKPGFLSWNATWAFHKDFSSMSQFLTDGVEFQLQALEPKPGGLQRLYFGSRYRPNYYGGPPDDLVRDFAFAEGPEGVFLYLTAAGLPVGTYRMTTWHYDPFFGSDTSSITMQIEVGDKQGDMVAAATTVVADQVPLGASPQTFKFQVDSPNSIKEFVFRSDNSWNRARLNGFTLFRVPEPSTFLPLLTALSFVTLCYRQR